MKAALVCAGATCWGMTTRRISISFNISKINATENKPGAAKSKVAKIKRLQEYIGESYFEYLSNLPDLVLLMDEAHRYRATAGANAINELKPLLGIELTATPKSVGAKVNRFQEHHL
jgi:type III restriction enzyme